MLVIAGLVGLAVAAILVPIAWARHRTAVRLVRERDEQAAEAARAKDENRRLLSLLDASPDVYIAWIGGTEWAAPRLGAAIGLGTEPAGYEAVLAAAVPRDRAPLADAVQALRADGRDFTLAAAFAGGRHVRAIGRRIKADGPADVVWLLERSTETVDAAQLRATASEASEERDRLQATLDGLPMPVWRRDADRVLAWCNAAYAAALETDAAKAVSERRELAPGLRDNRGQALAEVAAAGAKAKARAHIVIGGQRRLLEIQELPDDGGRIVGYASDITELAEARMRLDQHLAAHAEVLEALASAIAIYGSDTRLIFFNQSFARMWRLEPAFLASKPNFGEVLEAMRERRRLPEYVDFRAYKAELLRLFTSVIEPKEDMMHLPDNTALRTLVAPHPFGGLMFLYEDVTDRLALERQYNTLTEVQRETLNNLHEGVAVFGGDGRLRLSNPEFARLWNLAPEDVADGPHIADLVDKTRALFAPASDWAARKTQIIARVTEPEARAGRLERMDQKVIDFAVTPLPDGACLLTYIDVTDTIRVERALRERNMALEAADRLKTEFIANVSYELRTPLNAIIGFTEILTEEYFGTLNDRQREYIRAILSSSQGLRNLINDILDLATIEAGFMELQKGAVDVPQLLAGVAALNRERAGSRGLTLAIDCPSDIGTIEGDELRLKQALFNLVSNALKFTPAGGQITLSARRGNGEVELSVADTGVGIAEEDQSRIFEKFERGAGQSRHAGAGLGLALVRSLVELHGGRVRLRSARGQGTTVVCVLPGREGPVAAPRAEIKRPVSAA